jgi:hypothetical protein
MADKSAIDQFQIEWMQVWLASMTALWGGLVSYFRRIQQGAVFSWTSIVMHMSMSGFAGLMCWLACAHFETPTSMTAICTGLAGHMGAEFIKILEDRFESKLRAGLNTPEAPEANGEPEAK